MKNILIIIAFFTLSAEVTVAQDNNSDDDDSREKLQLGIRAGVNYSNVYDAKGEKFTADPKAGLAGGLLIAIPIGKYLGVQPEVLLSQKGFVGDGFILGSRYDFSRTTTYIDVPLQFAFKPIRFITILAGPQFSYLVNQKDVFTSSPISYQQEQEFKQDDVTKNIFSAVCGIDANFNRFFISGRANWDLQTNAGDGTSSTPRYKNVWYQATIGFKLYKK